MSLITTVKLNAITNLSDARYGAGMGVQMMGFCMDPDDPRFMDVLRYNELVGWVSGIETVGEFITTDSQLIKQMAADYHLDWIQIRNPELVHELQPLGKSIIISMPLNELDRPTLSYLQDAVGFILVDYYDTLPNDLLKQQQDHGLIMLNIGNRKPEVRKLLEYKSVAGFAINSGDEIRPGFGNFDELADVLELLEED